MRWAMAAEDRGDRRVPPPGGGYRRGVPTYEYRCLECDDRFELRRPVGEADHAATCPGGHVGARRLLSVFAAAGRAGAPSPSGGGGCCGGGCGCGAG